MPPESTPAWPPWFPPPDELLAWLARVERAMPAAVDRRHLLTLRYLALAAADAYPPPPAGLS